MGGKRGLFGVKLYATMGIVVTILLTLCCCFSLILWIHCIRRKSGRRKNPLKPSTTMTINQDDDNDEKSIVNNISEERRIVEKRIVHIRDGSTGIPGSSSGTSISSSEAGKVTLVNGVRSSRMDMSSLEGSSYSSPDATHTGWGHCYALRDLEVATDSFSESKIVGKGGYGIVYHGILRDGTPIAVKKLVNNRGQAEREFKVEVEAIGRVRHKNLVRLFGYCMEGVHRILVYEYIDNGNLDQWLHGSLGEKHQIPWDIRMKILLGTAKGLAYLHEGLEPKVVHRDIKSSNILLDRGWNPKISDFGLAKLLGPDNTHVTTRVMGTFGYVAPEYANTGLLNEKSDVYSYGVLLMELMTGRDPVDYRRPQGEVNLVDWLKVMVGSRQIDGVCDPRMEVKPSWRALKRVLLVSLRCVDPDAEKRPKISHVIQMLETEDNPFHEINIRRISSRSKAAHADSDSGRSTDNDASFSKIIRSESGSESEPTNTRGKWRNMDAKP